MNHFIKAALGVVGLWIASSGCAYELEASELESGEAALESEDQELGLDEAKDDERGLAGVDEEDGIGEDDKAEPDNRLARSCEATRDYCVANNPYVAAPYDQWHHYECLRQYAICAARRPADGTLPQDFIPTERRPSDPNFIWP